MQSLMLIQVVFYIRRSVVDVNYRRISSRCTYACLNIQYHCKHSQRHFNLNGSRSGLNRATSRTTAKKKTVANYCSLQSLSMYRSWQMVHAVGVSIHSSDGTMRSYVLAKSADGDVIVWNSARPESRKRMSVTVGENCNILLTLRNHIDAGDSLKRS